MEIPLNVFKNNLFRASIVAREWNKNQQCSHLEDSVEYFKKKGEEFLKVHENTCAIYEAILVVYKGSIGYTFILICPCCKKTENITNSDCW